MDLEIYIPQLWGITAFAVVTGLVLAIWPAISKRAAAGLTPFFQRLASIAKPALWMTEDTRHFAITAFVLGGVLMTMSPALALLNAQGLPFIVFASTTLFVFIYGVMVLAIAAITIFLTTLRSDRLKVRDAGVKFICTAIVFAGWVLAITVNAV